MFTHLDLAVTVWPSGHAVRSRRYKNSLISLGVATRQGVVNGYFSVSIFFVVVKSWREK
jgi:hypothetical protein